MDYGVLARSYNTLQYENQLRKVLVSFYKDISFDGLTKYALHQMVNNALLDNYHGEEILKFKLAKLFRVKDYVAAFEVRVKSSRADFLVINGETKCFEIKSKIDTLNRLGKQSSDYKDVFEYNTVVIAENHLKLIEQIIPEYYGIWFFDGDEKIEYRKSQLSPFLDSISQLGLMTKKELNYFFATTDINSILDNSDNDNINLGLKNALKKRYEPRWTFLKSNWENILPIDIQFFFNTNISPELIYST